MISNNTNLGYVKSEEEAVENLVQALINFAELDTPLENPPETQEREPNWRRETRMDEEIKGDPKYVPYEEERFKKVWEELELSLEVQSVCEIREVIIS